MQGASRLSMAAAREALQAQALDPTIAGLSEQLLAVSALLGRETKLRTALTDPGQSSERRVMLANSILGTQLSPLALSVVTDAVARRWTNARDLVDAVEALGADAAFIVAENVGNLDVIENELFGVGRVVNGSPSLRKTLTDPAVSDTAKAALVGELLAGKVSPVTSALVTHVTANPRGRRVEDAVESLVSAASVRRNQLLAEVTVAAAIDELQKTNLAAALSRIYGQPVNIQVIIDPEVLGGVSVRVNNEVINATISSRIAEAKQAFGT